MVNPINCNFSLSPASCKLNVVHLAVLLSFLFVVLIITAVEIVLRDCLVALISQLERGTKIAFQIDQNGSAFSSKFSIINIFQCEILSHLFRLYLSWSLLAKTSGKCGTHKVEVGRGPIVLSHSFFVLPRNSGQL